MKVPSVSDDKQCTVRRLVDIRDISVDMTLPRASRIAEFIRQIENPYHFRCGAFTVKASFAKNGAPLEDCIRGILRNDEAPYESL